ncbi:N-acetylmuramoyl-L-alanine amidase [Neobacillus notoginsengisoli]|uniref:N-acetylmuramoyl-L-alanine amidase n=1 Tax=Neobacillus notoginsengisoli TaxID=1578198 RepID=A0A417YRB0_9BACI|nr:SH3 domain-containing protein [Neobacillus notoginsengisoli]RHW37276.1 N-acetylmuramoyl-L-alanine amidase [Neobacillus notoginsengisoli]
MKKIFVSSVLLTAALLPGVSQAEGATVSNNLVTGKPTEIRKGATTAYPLVAKIGSSQQVSVQDTFINSSGEVWYRITAGKYTGWSLANHFPVITNGFTLGKPATISESIVNVRKGASTSYAIVAKLSKGQQVSILDSFRTSSGELWYRIKTGNSIGWVLSSLVTVNDGSTFTPVAAAKPATNIAGLPTVGSYYTITAASLDARKGAASSYAIVAKVTKGQKYKVIGQFLHKNGEGWIRIQINSKLSGWIPVLKAAEVKPPANIPGLPTIGSSYTIPVASLDARKGASTSYAIVAKVTKGKSFKVISQHMSPTGDGWVRIQISATLAGWIPIPKAAEEKPPANIPGLPTLGSSYSIAATTLNVRKGASTNYAIVTKVTKGQSFNVIGQYMSPTGDGWVRIQVSSSLAGWIMVKQGTVSTPAPSTTMTVFTRNAVLYSNAGFSGTTVIERIPYLSKVSLFSDTKTVSGVTWVKIKTAAGNTGWTPNYEVASSQANLTHVYALKNAAVRKSATTSAALVVTLAENQQILVLNEYNGWLNVETGAGKRGWVLKTQTSPYTTKRLFSPETYISNNDVYLRWQKPSTLNLAYSTPAANQLKIYGGLSDVEIPSFAVKGIKSIQKVAANTTEKAVLITFQPGYSFTIRNYNNNITIKVVQSGLAGKRIILDPGHGGKDPGAIGPTGLREKVVVLDTALILKAELERAGAIVTMTRSTDVFLELAERTAISNSSDGDAFISLHTDAFNEKTNGTTSFYNTTVNFNGLASKELANAIQKNLIVSLGTYNRGVKEEAFYVNRMNELPSILVEMAFISNPSEEALLKTTAFRQKAAIGIKNGLQEYFNK